MRAPVFCAMLAFAVSLPGAVFAQQNFGSGGLGSRLPAATRGLERSAANVVRGDALVARQMPCITAALRGRAAALLATLPGSAEEARIFAVNSSRLERCLLADTFVALDAVVLRSVAASTLIPAAGVAVPAKIVDDKARAAWILGGVTPIANERVRSIHFFARCVSADAPPLAVSYVATAPASPQESAALTALQPTMAGCLPANATFRTDRTMLRGLLAEALLKLAAAGSAAAGTASGGGV